MSVDIVRRLIGCADVSAVQRVLAAAPHLVTIRDSSGQTPLWLAIEQSPDMVRLLIHAGAEVNVRDDNGSTPLHQAAQDGMYNQAEILIAHGADVHAQNHTHQTPLHLAATYGQADVTALLLAHGAKVNVQDRHGYTPLHYAVYGNIPVYERDHYDRTATILLQAGADVTIRTNAGESVVELARRHTNTEATLRLLREYGAT